MGDGRHASPSGRDGTLSRLLRSHGRSVARNHKGRNKDPAQTSGSTSLPAGRAKPACRSFAEQSLKSKSKAARKSFVILRVNSGNCKIISEIFASIRTSHLTGTHSIDNLTVERPRPISSRDRTDWETQSRQTAGWAQTNGEPDPKASVANQLSGRARAVDLRWAIGIALQRCSPRLTVATDDQPQTATR